MISVLNRHVPGGGMGTRTVEGGSVRQIAMRRMQAMSDLGDRWRSATLSGTQFKPIMRLSAHLLPVLSDRNMHAISVETVVGTRTIEFAIIMHDGMLHHGHVCWKKRHDKVLITARK